MMDKADITFLTSLKVCGVPPMVYPESWTVQWNLPGMNFKDQCFQGVIHQVNGVPTITLQVFRKPEAPDAGRSLQCVPLGATPYRRDQETRLAVERIISRWGGLRRDAYLSPDPWSFRTWVEATENQPVSDLMDLMRVYFGNFYPGDRLPPDKVGGFLSLPRLREVVGKEQVQTVQSILAELPRERKRNLTYQWLLNSLRGQL